MLYRMAPTGAWTNKRIENVDLEKRIMTGGIKTKAGTNRVVPIHSKIFNLVERRYKEALSINSNRLLNCTDTTTHKSNPYLTYDKYIVGHSISDITEKIYTHRNSDWLKSEIEKIK